MDANPYKAPDSVEKAPSPGILPWRLIELLGCFSVALGLLLFAYNYVAGLDEAAAGQQPSNLRFGHIPTEALWTGVFLITVAGLRRLIKRGA